jgi:transketolase
MKLALKEIEKLSISIRKEIVAMITKANSGHCAGPLGAVELYVSLYFGGVLKYDSQKPNLENRDRVVISNGHYAPLIYSVLAHAGYFPLEKLKTLRKLGSQLQGHSYRLSLPGIETSSGPVGEGLSQAVGMALGAKLDKKKYQIYCFMGDGEQDCGNTWEAVMTANKYQLDNLTAIIDRNNIQIDGFTENVMPLESLKEKYESFGWKVLEIDGHNISEIIKALNSSKSIFVKPVIIIAHTIPGKGIDFMQWEHEWHGRVPDSQQAEEALRQLRNLKGKIESELE